jgi:hypothetical protein
VLLRLGPGEKVLLHELKTHLWVESRPLHGNKKMDGLEEEDGEVDWMVKT